MLSGSRAVTSTVAGQHVRKAGRVPEINLGGAAGRGGACPEGRTRAEINLEGRWAVASQHVRKARREALPRSTWEGRRDAKRR